MTTVAIIGGGFSGTVLALNLLEHGSPYDQVLLIEKKHKIGLGHAYSTRDPDHLLNVAAASMSPFSRRPEAFVDYLAQYRDLLPGDVSSLRDYFAPRIFYGRFLDHIVTTKLKSVPGRPELIVVHGIAVDIRSGTRDEVILADGRSFYADRIVLASGNLPPRAPREILGFGSLGRRYLGSPWDSQSLEAIPSRASILLIGTGLTMIDCVLSLARKHKGPMVAVSRHGLLPRRQEPVSDWDLSLRREDTRSVRRLLRQIRNEIARAEAQGYHWQCVIKSLRSITQSLWAGLSQNEQARFIRHVRPWWDVHRHRIAPAVADKIDWLVHSGQLKIIAGRIERFDVAAHGARVDVNLRNGTCRVSFNADAIINCSGPNYDFSTGDDLLLKSLLAKGRISQNVHRLGLHTTADFAIVDREGDATGDLFAMGPLLRGQFWEVNAVPEIVGQAETLAPRLLAEHDRSEFYSRRHARGFA